MKRFLTYGLSGQLGLLALDRYETEHDFSGLGPHGFKLAQIVKFWLLGSRRVDRHPYFGALEQKYQWIFAHPECLKVPSQLKMFNIDCWDPGDSIETHIFGFGKKVQNLEFPTKRPLGGLRTSRGQDPKPSFQALISGS